MDVEEIFKTVIGLIITAYLAFIIISQLSQQTPGFSPYGIIIFGALIAGIALFFKQVLFNR